MRTPTPSPYAGKRPTRAVRSDARSVATRLLQQVIGQRRSLSEITDAGLGKLPDPRDRALVQALVYGTLRWLPRLQAILGQLLREPMKPRDADVEALLCLGLYQHLALRIPPHAATAATVEVAHGLGKPWAVGLVNAVLRNFLRQQESMLATVDSQPAARYLHPAWWLERFQQDWPADWTQLAEANNQQAPMSLRVNRLQGGREAYLAALAAVEIAASPLPHSALGIQLTEPVDVGSLPGFASGQVSVQDAAAQLAAELLAVPPGARVLDACAAPGGKTAHLLEMQPSAQLLALDKEETRLVPLRENLQRLGLQATVRVADAARPASWWDGQPFQRILLDAPCSASGVIRRHPDIKYLRRASDIAVLAAQQQQLLTALWPLLAPAGLLLYATCSVFAQENVQQIQQFLAQHPDAEAVALPTTWGRPQAVGRQILPGDDDMDGFYYALLRKRDTDRP